MRRIGLLTVCCCALLAFGEERAPSPLAERVPLVLKVLGYDANFETRGVGEFVVLVGSDAKRSGDRKALMESLKTAPELKVKGRLVKFATAELADEASVQHEIDRTKASAVLVLPGSSDAVVKAISEVIQDNQIYGLGLDAESVQHALPVGVTLNDGRPQIVINEKAAKAVGARFESSVLRLAKVIATEKDEKATP